VKLPPQNEAIAAAIERALDAAGLRNASNGAGSGVRATIDRALATAGLAPAQRGVNGFAEPAAPVRPRTPPLDATPIPGRLSTQRHVGPHGEREFALYLPSNHDGVTPLPLLVMLHGCKQDPRDFALGTRMNEVAEARGFVVAYPAQSARANGGCCWNWFEGAQQQRGAPEPASIVGVVEQLVAQHAVDRSRVFVAGLSAGAAMALLLGRHYPEVFAGVAAHSGLPAGAARDMPSAFAAMSGGPAGTLSQPPGPALPTIVFHGDVDATVVPRNGHAIVDAALAAWRQEGLALQESVRLEVHAGGRLCTTTEYRDTRGRALVESWTVHGAAHAWSGGSSAGSYTDVGGPDASAQIARFFLER
jgi:poly(hydroxyalkanoate) depolymerase family esterase